MQKITKRLGIIKKHCLKKLWTLKFKIDNPTPNFQLPSDEKLLVEVQINEKEIPSDKKNNSKSKIKIDAVSLLSTVEKELDENYKETTLDKLTRKFQDAKTAIANRNYE